MQGLAELHIHGKNFGQLCSESPALEIWKQYSLGRVLSAGQLQAQLLQHILFFKIYSGSIGSILHSHRSYSFKKD